MPEDTFSMRGYMRLAETLAYDNDALEASETPAPETPKTADPAVFDELRNIVAKLRAHSEVDASEEQAVGVEMGMQRAADMIERVIRTYED